MEVYVDNVDIVSEMEETSEVVGSDIRFSDIWRNYPNLVDYFRFVLCIASTFVVCSTDWHWAAAGLLLLAFLLDIVDGRVARAYNQCTILGDGIDSVADLFVDVLLIVWWSRVEPPLQPWLLLVLMIKVAGAMLDFAMTSTDRYSRPGRQSGFCTVLEWTYPGGVYSRLGCAVWFCHPFFVVVRCLLMSDESLNAMSQQLSLLPGFVVVKWLLVVPVALSIWIDAAFLASGLKRWREHRRPQWTAANGHHRVD